MKETPALKAQFTPRGMFSICNKPPVLLNQRSGMGINLEPLVQMNRAFRVAVSCPTNPGALPQAAGDCCAVGAEKIH